MFENLQAHPILFIIVIALAYVAGAATLAAAVGHWILVKDPNVLLLSDDELEHERRMELDEDRDAIAEALRVIN